MHTGGNKLLSLVDTHQTIMDTFERSDGNPSPDPKPNVVETAVNESQGSMRL